MNIGIIGDSCCDLNEELQNTMDVKIVPLQITVDNVTYIDDANLNMDNFRTALKQTRSCSKSACPSPEAFAEAMREFDACVVVTLSSRLSGSYNAAVIAKDMVVEENPEKEIYVIDSLSAASGETILAKTVYDELQSGKTLKEAVEIANKKRDNLKTIFVLEDLSTMMKNGRLNKIAGKVATILSLRPILSDNGNGEITVRDKVRGTKNALTKMCQQIHLETENLAKSTVELVITHCNCEERAREVKEEILSLCPAIKNIIIVGGHGISTVYGGQGGIITAFSVI